MIECPSDSRSPMMGLIMAGHPGRFYNPRQACLMASLCTSTSEGPLNAMRPDAVDSARDP